MRQWLFLFAVLGSSCVGKDAANFVVARGTAGRLSARHGACDTDRASPAGIVDFDPRTRTYHAVAVGRVDVPCEGSDITFEVRPVARIEVEGPGRVRVGDKLSLMMRAFDAAGNPLVVGEADTIEWHFSGALTARDNPDCGDVLPDCAPRTSGYATATAPGKGEARAVFRGQEARLTVHVAE